MTEAISFVLVHAPLVGPSSWSWVATELEHRGHRASVPNLTGVAHALKAPFDHCVDAALEATPDGGPVVLVGHSGAGVLLPFIASRLTPPPKRLLFVDAGLPPASGAVQLADDQFQTFLDGLVDHEGMLRPWSRWWGEEAMQALVPDVDRRSAVESDIPRLPIRYYDHVTEVPRDWTQLPAAYLLLSERYRGPSDDARSRGWQVMELSGNHLHMVVDPAAVADALIELTHS